MTAGAAKRVLITLPSLRLPGGVANYYRTLRSHLDDRKVYFEIGSRPGETGTVAALWRLLGDYWRFHRVLASGHFDLVHINPSMGSRSVVRDGLLLLIAKAHGCPVLVFFRGWDPACEAGIRQRHQRLFRRVYGRADAFVVLAAEFRQTLTELGIRAPMFMETTLVDDAVFDAGAESTSASATFAVLYLGRLDQGKGLQEAIDAFARLQAQWPATTLTIAGDGPERPGIEADVQARGLTGVTFLGHVDGPDKAVLFQRAQVYLFTSLAEGMPNSVLEAMAFGLPIVTRPVGGLRDFFENGRMGFATESRDPAIWAELLGRLAGNPALRATMGRYNRDFARNRFSASIVAERLKKIYAQVGGQAAAD